MGQKAGERAVGRYNILKQCFLFRGLEELADGLSAGAGEPGAALSDGLELAEFASGENMFPAERQGRQMGIICTGRAAVHRSGESSVIMSILGEGDEFGAASLYSGRDYFVTDIIAMGGVTALYLDKVQIDALMVKHPQVARNYIAYLSQRIYFLNGRIDSFTSGSVERSLALYLADGAKGNGELVLPCSISSLADVLHVGRASLYRAFDSLTQQGIIQRNNRYIRILDMDKLNRTINL